MKRGKAMDQQTNQTEQQTELEDLMTLKLQYHSKGVVATVFGIISLIACLSPISLIAGIIAISVGGSTRKKSKGTVGTGGLVMGIIGTILSLIPILIVVASILFPTLLGSIISLSNMSF